MEQLSLEFDQEPASLPLPLPDTKRARRNPNCFVEVSCSDCGRRWMKWKYTVPQWDGRCKSCAQRERIRQNPERHRKLTEKLIQASKRPEVREKVAQTKREWIARLGGIPNRKLIPGGADHPKWRGGVTPENQKERTTRRYYEWRNAVFARDGYCCTLCGTKKGRFAADHIVPWAKDHSLRHDVANGRVLCRDCHLARHGLVRRKPDAPPKPPLTVSVTCKDCGVAWEKRKNQLSVWQGRCYSCSGKLNRAKRDKHSTGH